jgi:hypothetical protein
MPHEEKLTAAQEEAHVRTLRALHKDAQKAGVSIDDIMHIVSIVTKIATVVKPLLPVIQPVFAVVADGLKAIWTLLNKPKPPTA